MSLIIQVEWNQQLIYQSSSLFSLFSSYRDVWQTSSRECCRPYARSDQASGVPFSQFMQKLRHRKDVPAPGFSSMTNRCENILCHSWQSDFFLWRWTEKGVTSSTMPLHIEPGMLKDETLRGLVTPCTIPLWHCPLQLIAPETLKAETGDTLLSDNYAVSVWWLLYEAACMAFYRQSPMARPSGA